MASRTKAANDLARQLFKLSIEQGSISAAKVGGVLEYLEKHPPAQPMAVLKAYRRLIAAEDARSRALIEHAGSLPQAVIGSLTASLGRKYGRSITAVVQPNAGLIAGMRVRVGDDIYESSIAGQLAELAATV